MNNYAVALGRVAQAAGASAILASSICGTASASSLSLFHAAIDRGVSAIERATLHEEQRASGKTLEIRFPARCDDEFVDMRPPKMVNVRLKARSYFLCANSYATLYSGLARAPIYSAEYLSPERLAAAAAIGRYDTFFEDERVGPGDRARLDAYRNSGFDRGHLAPSADMPSDIADAQSFVLSNIVPQDPGGNRTVWAAIEEGVRALARHRPIYVVTGVLWLDAKITAIGREKGVMVPTHLYKLVFDPQGNDGKGAAAAYLLENRAGKREHQVQLSELERLAQIEFFPSRSNIGSMKLPRPRYR